MWTKHIICTLLSSYFVISPLKWRKRTDRQTSACAVCTTSPTYPSSFTPQCSGIQHPLKSVVLPRQSAAHHQLLAFAPSITQHILQKKKNKHLVFSGIYKYLPQFSRSLQNQLQKLTAHYVHPLSQHTEEPSRAQTQRQTPPGAALISLPSNAAGVSQCHNQALGGVSAGRS